MPELATAPSDTLDIANDIIYFKDVSETPDALNGSTLASMLSANKAAARTALEVDPTDDALYIDNYATLQDAYTAFESATEKLLLGNPSATYTITATATLNALVDKIVDLRGATIRTTGAATQYGTRFTGVWSNSTFRNARFTSDGGGTHLGIVWDSTVNGTHLQDCTFEMPWQGIVYQGSGYPKANRISGCRVTGTAHSGIAISGGEYCIISNCLVYSNTATGILVSGGNIIIANCSVAVNAIGIDVDSNGIANGDHGTIIGCMINHNTKCGIRLKDLVYGMVVTGNQIAANDGANLGAAPQDSSFGIYVFDGVGVQVTDNHFLRNKYSIGIEGIDKSVFGQNRFTGDNTLTTRHIKETGGTNTNYLIDGNVVGQDLLTNTVVLATDCPGATLGTNIVA